MAKLMNLTEAKKEALNFTGEHDGYIHALMKDGNGEQLLGGSPLSLCHMIAEMVIRISDMSTIPTSDLVDLIGTTAELRKGGYFKDDN